jgi:hypothetical protein
MPAVQPNAKMMPALEVCQPIVRLTALMVGTHKDDIRKREQEKRPKIMSVSHQSDGTDRTNLLKYCQ